MQKLDYLRQKKLNPGDELRALLEALEQRRPKFQAMTSTQALILLRELDQVYKLFEEVEAAGLNLLPERGRFKAIEPRFRKEAAPLLKALGGPAALAEHRPKPSPSQERWWWYLDEMTAARRKQTLARVGAGLVLVVLLIGGIVLVFNTILAPSPEARISFEVENKVDAALEEQEYQAALTIIEAGLNRLPTNPGFLIYKGVLQQTLGETAEAEETFKQAQDQINDPLRFHLARSQLRIRLNQPERAEADARRVIDLDEKSARGWLLLGQALEFQGQEFEAISAYQQAGQLAIESGDNEIVVLARLALGQLGAAPAPREQ